MMKTPHKFITLLSGAVLLASSAFAQTVATDPVGYVTNTVNANSDLKVGVPFTQAATFDGVVDSVASGIITVASTVPDVTTDAHFVWVTSGNLEGQWFTVTGSTSSTVIVAEDLAAAGLATTDNFRMLPFWTLGTLLLDGGGLPPSASPSTILSNVLLNDVTAEGVNLSSGGAGNYFYFDNGSVSGWLDASNPVAFIDNTIIPPTSYLTLRNSTGSPATITFSGSVPVEVFSNRIVSRAAGAQDNQVFLPYPADTLIGDLGLVEAGAISSTNNPSVVSDFLLVYSKDSSGLNPSTSSTYFHFDNGSVSGWLDASNPVAFVDSTVVIPASSALIVRRAASSDTAVEWSAPLPYNL